MQKISFARDEDGFSLTLRNRIEEYFRENKIAKTGDWRLYSKTIIILTAFFTIYTVLLTVAMPTWLAVMLCILQGFVVSLTGFNVMHDGAHGSYSSKQWVNQLMAYSLDMLGGSSYFWKTKHNVAHHSFTNVEGHDDDLNIKPFIRLSEHQPRKWFHKFQVFYWPFLYALAWFWWISFRDAGKYITRKVGETPIPPMKLREHIEFFGGKLLYISLFWVIPSLVLGFKPVLIGNIITLATGGLFISIVFQLAHTVEDLDFAPPATESPKVEKSWFVHQLSTTANFATRNKFVNWITGGLNFQVEHHLFPKISHVHYPAINSIVKDVCKQFNVSYHENKTFFSAVWSHLKHLRQMGAA